MPKLSKEEFYKTYYPIVADSVKGTGLHPEVVMAQMAVESGWGGSGLTTKHNNFFGIKSHGKSGGVEMNTQEERGGKRVNQKSDFRTYNTPEESVKDYVNFIQTNPRYKKVLAAKTPEEQADALGKSGYSTSSNYGNSLKSTIKANKDKIKAMPEQNKKSTDQEKIDRFKRSYSKNLEELNYLKTKYGINSKEFKEKKAKMDRGVAGVVYKQQQMQENEIKKSIEEAEKNKDWTRASQLIAEQKKFDSNKIDFTKTKDKLEMKSNVTIDEKGKRRGYGSKPIIAGKEPDLNYNSLYKVFESDLKANPVQEETETDLPIIQLNDEDASSGTDGRGKSSYKKQIQIDDLGLTTGGQGQVGALEGSEDYEFNAKKAEQDLADYQAYQREAFDDTYAPDYKNDNDILGSLIDSGRAIMGMIGASEDVPKYERGSMFSTAMDEALRNRNMGLSSDEINFRRGMAERGFGYDVKNIRRLAGGSAGVALGNLGRATNQLYDQYGQIAATDEATRRLNRQNFQGMALKDESINRQIFQDDLTQVMMNKEAGAGLVQDALQNIQERRDFNKQYGKGSPYYEYTKGKTLETRRSLFDLDQANKERVYDYENQLKSNVAQTQEQLLDEVSIDGTEKRKPLETPNVIFGETESANSRGGTVKRGYIDESKPKNSLFKDRATTKASSNRNRADEITSLMNELEPDDPQFEKLSKELDNLKY